MAMFVVYAGKCGATKRLMCASWPFRAPTVATVLFWGEAITARHRPRGVGLRGPFLARPVSKEINNGS